MKTTLLRPRKDPHKTWAFNPRLGHSIITESLPFYKSKQGRYVHRIRSGTIHILDGAPTHSSFELWCGMVGSVGVERSRGSLMACVSAKDMVCATCEGRFIGAGLSGSPTIDGQPVKFSPHQS